MIKYTKIPENIELLLLNAKTYLSARTDVLFAYLFGSLAKGKPRPLSDVDIAVSLSDNKDLAEKKMEILGDLTDILKTDEIDLVILNSASLPLKMRILKNKKILADNMPFARHVYESLTMREYFDFSITEQNILKRRFFNG